MRLHQSRKFSCELLHSSRGSRQGLQGVLGADLLLLGSSTTVGIAQHWRDGSTSKMWLKAVIVQLFDSQRTVELQVYAGWEAATSTA